MNVRFAGGSRYTTGFRTALLLLASVAAACGYRAGSLIRPEYRRVALPMFQNETFYRDLELSLTRQVESELSSRQGIFIVPPEEADIVLVGTILDFRQRVLSEDDLDRIRESSATVRVRIEIRDAHQPGRVLETFEVADRAEFFIESGENLGTATGEAFFDLSRRIVNALETRVPRASRIERDTTPASQVEESVRRESSDV